MTRQPPRSIAVVDVGFTNTKVVQFDGSGQILAKRITPSFHRAGPLYREIEADPLIAFCEQALRQLDAETPVDIIVPCAHGAALACLNASGDLALPVMDYTSAPPPDLIARYKTIEPPFSECFGPLLPMALTHALQLYWQENIAPEAFATVTTILPWIQYIGYRLCGTAVTEVSSMSCQTQLMNIPEDTPSSLAIGQGWAKHFAPRAKAWDVIGTLTPTARRDSFRGDGLVLAGVHDSNANYLRYLAAGLDQFTLLSTGTWIIGFDTAADIAKLDHAKDTVTNTDVFGRTVACCRFYGGQEFEIVSQGADGFLADVDHVQSLVANGVFALAAFTDSGGPLPGSAGQGAIVGPFTETPTNRASLAALYCALMTSQSLDAIQSKHQIIVDGPFAQNLVYMQLLAALRPDQSVFASGLRDGTTAGAACLGLMPNGKLPHIALKLVAIAAPNITNLATYAAHWLKRSLHLKT
jgi:sugar (pentulose or hexulose) kinase